MKAKDIALILVVVVLVAFTPNSPISVLARDVLADTRPAPLSAGPVGTAFTYQGELTDGGVPADGVYDFQFKLWDAETLGGQIGSLVTRGDIVVAGGIFIVELDFGASSFAGEARWLEIGVRPGESSGSYTTLDPRQKVSPTPYALYASNADTLDGQHAAELGASHNHWGAAWAASGLGLSIHSYSGTAFSSSSDSGHAGSFINTDSGNTSSVLQVETNGPGYALFAQSTHYDKRAGNFDGNVDISGNLDIEGDLDLAGNLIERGVPFSTFYYASFQGANCLDYGGSSVKADGSLALLTNNNNDLEFCADSLMSPPGSGTQPIEGTNTPGSFFAARVQYLPPDHASGGLPIAAPVVAHVIGGGAYIVPAIVGNGYGFKSVGSALYGVSYLGQTESSVNLGVPVVYDGSYRLLAIVRSSALIEFYVDGMLRGSLNTAVPPDFSSHYVVRLTNGIPGTSVWLQVSNLLVVQQF